MNRLVQLVVVAFATGIAFIWRSPVEAAAAIAAVFSMMAIAVFLRPVRREDQTLIRRRRMQRRNYFWPVWTGLIIAAAGIGTIEIVRQTTAWWPSLMVIWSDRDRNVVESELNRLEDERRWQESADTITDRLKRPASAVWAETLKTRQVYEDINVAVRSEHMVETLSMLQDRLRRDNDDTSVIERLLDGFIAQATFESAKLKWQAEREVLQRSWAERLVETQLAAAYQVERYPLRSRRWLDTAASLVSLHGIDDDQLTETLARWQAPTELPESVTVEVIGSHSLGLNTTIDLAIAQQDGSPFVGLKVRDFSIIRDGKTVDAFSAEMTTVIGDQLQLALLIDCSSSTQGQPIQQAIAGAIRLVEAVNETGEHRVWRFGTDVRPLIDWSRLSAESVTQLSRLKADGLTALLRAIEQALADLARRSGRRVMVIFSDGKDTVGGNSADRLVTRCRDLDVTIFVVALQTADVDLPLLKKLSDTTGGQLFVAAKADRLIQTFEDLIRQLRRPTYRLTVLADEPTDEPIDIQIGDNPGRHMTVTMAASPRNLTTHQTAKPTK